jgi:S-(hydroxymethyl)glutathione dehydrogenase/alcohol dehydrogenase
MEVAALYCAVTTGPASCSANARVRIGESVVVFSAGGAGLNIIQPQRWSPRIPSLSIYDNRLERNPRARRT